MVSQTDPVAPHDAVDEAERWRWTLT
ncbi:MAG: hypothetical protein AVDCRST_MAG88-4429, partial [uncultured Thermomicrobiales bacterium]